MCGIVGVITKRKNGLFNADLDIFTDMLFADQVRGAHGTGIFYDSDTECKAFKGAMPSSAFLRSEKLPPVFEEIIKKSNFVIGHNRHATKGGISFDNTHPFIENGITLIHNGTLYAHRNLKDVEVDSHAICHSIGEIGHEETIKKIDGAFALVWFNSETQQLHFIRNSERPLHMIETEHLIVLSSEAGLAEWILKRRNAAKVGETKMCEVGQLYTYDPTTNKITEEKMELRPKTVYHYGQGYYQGKYDFDYYDNLSPHSPKKGKNNTPPPRYHNPQYNFIDVRVGDGVLFSPIDVKNTGKTHVLSGLVERLIDEYKKEEDLPAESQLICYLYNSNQEGLNQLLDHAVCKGTVIQIVYRGQEKTVVLKDVKPVIQALPALLDKSVTIN